MINTEISKEQMYEELYERLKDRRVLEVFESVHFQLHKRIPDGKTVHLYNTAGYAVSIRIGFIRLYQPRDMSFKYYKEKYPEEYRTGMERLEQCIRDFDIRI